MEPNLNSTSPYYQPEASVALFKLRLIQHLDLLRMPRPDGLHGQRCSQECHIAERNHTIETIKHFVSNVQAM